jgi:hypothetical protein
MFSAISSSIAQTSPAGSRHESDLEMNAELSDDNVPILVENLRNVLLRERDEANLLRAEIASVAMSLEYGKNRLESMLHDESDRLPRGGQNIGLGSCADAKENELEIARSLESQLQATLETLQTTEIEESKLLKEIASLRTIDAVFQSADDDSECDDDLESLGERFMDALRVSYSSAVTATPEDRLGAWNWRERTLPNISVIAQKSEYVHGRRDQVHSGIVVERIFDETVAFVQSSTLLNARGDGMVKPLQKSEEYLLSLAEAPEGVAEDELLSLASEYSTLTVQDLSAAHGLRLVAISSALQSVRQLIESHQSAVLQSKTFAVPKSLDGVNVAGDSQKTIHSDGATVVQALSTTSLPSPEAAARFLGRGSAVSIVDPPPTTSHKSAILSNDQFARVLAALPARFHEHDLQRLYSTAVDGISLGTLYRRVAGFEPTLICLRDTAGHTMGCYAPTAWRGTSKSSNIFKSKLLHVQL